MGSTEKKFNKLLIGAIIGSALIGAGSLSMTPKGKSFWRRMLSKGNHRTRFFVRGMNEMKKEFFGKNNEKKKGVVGKRKSIEK